MKTLSFALIDGDVTIQVPYPMTPESFEMLLVILKLQRPALVSVSTPKDEGETDKQKQEKEHEHENI